MTTPDQATQKMIATLNNTLPGLSCEVGTPERKILDVVGEAISEAYVGSYLNGSLMDIDSKAGLELEQFISIFGFGRHLGKPAIGTVRITLNTITPKDITFAKGTQFYTQPGIAGVTTKLYYASTQTVILVAGNLTCDIPVQCTTVGSNGNLPPDSLTYLSDVIGGSTVTNLTAMTGGVDTETDAHLRQRFKDTLLRNVAGTSDYYKALCQQNATVSRVAVFGPLSLYHTQIQVPASNTSLAIDVNQDVKYAWNNMESVFTGLGTEDEVFYSPLDDYAFEGGATPNLTPISTGDLVQGDFVDLEFQYTTRSSRNNPENNITNKVDIFVDGVNPVTVSEKTMVVSDQLSDVSTDPLYTGHFVRVGSPGSPSSSNRFMRLGSVPIVSFPSTITVGTPDTSGGGEVTHIYTEGTDYFRLADNNPTTLLRGSHLEVSGIEWTSNGPANGQQLTLSYVYNNTPELLNALIAQSKQITTDVMVHQGNFDYIQPCLSVEYSRSYSVATANSAIVNALQGYFSQMAFGAQIKLSMLSMYVQQVLGVASVWVTTADEDPNNYGIQRFKSSTNTTPYITMTEDFKLDDNQLALYQGVKIKRIATP